MKKKSLNSQLRKFLHLWRSYNLSIILGLMFAITWFSQFLVQLKHVKNQALEKGNVFEWSKFWPEFWTSTLENWQSEFLQLFTFVVLTAFLIQKGSPESRDSEERTERKINKILRLLEDKKK